MHMNKGIAFFRGSKYLVKPSYPNVFVLCVSSECSTQRLFFLLLGIDSITLFKFDLEKKEYKK